MKSNININENEIKYKCLFYNNKILLFIYYNFKKFKIFFKLIKFINE